MSVLNGTSYHIMYKLGSVIASNLKRSLELHQYILPDRHLFVLSYNNKSIMQLEKAPNKEISGYVNPVLSSCLTDELCIEELACFFTFEFYGRISNSFLPSVLFTNPRANEIKDWSIDYVAEPNLFSISEFHEYYAINMEAYLIAALLIQPIFTKKSYTFFELLDELNIQKPQMPNDYNDRLVHFVLNDTAMIAIVNHQNRFVREVHLFELLECYFNNMFEAYL